MKFLLPYPFKRAGTLMAPLGFIVWLATVKDLVTALLVAVLGPDNPEPGHPPYSAATITIAVISFFSFLFGLYFIAFSREKTEDEMVRLLRLESFQFAALTQLCFFIASIIIMSFGGEPNGDGSLAMFLLFTLITFWISFIARFQWVLHRRARLSR